MQYAIILAALAGSAIAAPAQDACLEKCNAADTVCRYAPGANQAECSRKFSECVGYVPYVNGNFVAPTACSSQTGAAATPAVPVKDACVDKCNAAYSSCRTAPGANQATCAAAYSGCLGYLPYSNGTLITPTACSAQPSATPTAKPATDACVDKCNAAYSSCRTAPGANQAICAAAYSGCLGYLPYVNGTLVTPTACSAQVSVTPVYTTQVVTSFTTYCPAPTTLTFNDKTYTVTAATTLTITDCPCTLTTAIPAPAPTKPVVVAPAPVPSSVPAPAPVPATGTVPATVPTSANGTPVVFTGAAEAVKPGMAMLALGALAFL